METERKTNFKLSYPSSSDLSFFGDAGGSDEGFVSSIVAATSGSSLASETIQK